MGAHDSESSGSVAALSVLIVEPDVDDRLALATMFREAEFRVTATETFAHARAALLDAPPAILITTVRLGPYNGLHLVLRSATSHPGLRALVTSPNEDPVLRADAEAMGATFIVKPVSSRDLIAAVLRAIYEPHQHPLQPPFERREGERRLPGGLCVAERRLADRRRDRSTLVRGRSSVG